MRQSDRMWGVILFGIMGIAGGALCPATAAPEALSIRTVAAVGQAAPAGPALAGPRELSFPLPAVGHSLNIVARLGATNATWKLSLGQAASLTLVAGGGPPAVNEIWKLGGYEAKEKNPAALALVSAPDTFMTLRLSLPDRGGVTLPYFLKPNLNFYVTNGVTGENERAAMAARYPEFPSALSHAFTVRMEQGPAGLDLWLDGRYLGLVPAASDLTAGHVALAKGNELLNAFDAPALRAGDYLPLDLAPYARPGACRFLSEISGFNASALNTVEKIPFFYGESKQNIDVGLSRYLEEASGGGYCDNDTTRNAFIGCPESIILQAPKENIIAAHVLCAVEPATNKIPVLTLRVTRFGRHYGDSGGRCDEAFADTTVVLPANAAEPLPEHVKKVGDIKAAGLTAGAAEQTLPVYLVTVPLKLGEIPDLMGNQAPHFDRGNQHWDIELTKVIRLKGTRRKPAGLPSAVHVFGMTLERSPVDVRISAREAGNIFYAADNPRLDVRLANARDEENAVTLSWNIADYYGRKTQGSAKVIVPARTENGGVAVASVPLAPATLGYFDAVITVSEDRSGRELWRQATSFVLLPPDTRQAGPESPYGTWWFCGSHGTCDDVDVMGPIMMKLGMRHVCPSGAGKYAESNLAPYKLSYSMVNWGGIKTEADLDAFVQKNPNIRLGMIFHENSISEREKDYPYAELVGKPKPELTPKGKEELDKLWQRGEERAQLYRTKYPKIKITLGNTHSPLIVQLLRHGFPKKYMDCIGIEGVSGWTTPEGQPDHSYDQEIWWVREIQRLYGYGDIPVSSGYEYITRGTQRGSGLTEREQADYYIRDALQCLAYGYWSINIGSSDDFTDSYNATIYGGGGFVRRSPLLTPKPVYASWATMTRLLDSAKYTRYLETGSRSLYALEFKRENGYVYPVWTVRGKRPVTVALGGGQAAGLKEALKSWLADKGLIAGQGSGVSLTDGMGNTIPLAPWGGKVTLEASPSPVYLVTSRPIGAITPGPATFDDSPLISPVVVSDFSDPAAWEMEEKNPGIGVGGNPTVVGTFTLSPVKDPEKGQVTELTLEPDPAAPKIASRCVFLKARAPLTVKENARRLGLWVKGNSCWGRVFFEFVDAKGERYRTKTQYWDRHKVEYTSGINFDGWFFISQDIPRPPAQGREDWARLDPETAGSTWRSGEGDKDDIVQFPITVTRVAVAMRDWQVYVTNMVPAQSRSIRLGPLMAGD